MKVKLDKKVMFNIYTMPALFLTLLNLIVILTNFDAMTVIVVVLNISFWISGILLYMNKTFSSLISIVPIVVSFIISIRSPYSLIDPYWTHGLILLFYIVCELIIFYKKNNVKSYLKKIVSSILVLIVIISTVFCIIDYIRIKNEKMPIFMILLDASDEAEYIGLGYRFTLNNGIAPSAGILSNSEYYFGSWFYLFGTESNTFNDVVDIIDKIEEEDKICGDALEYFYEDRENIYYFSCLKKHDIIVKYEDGSEKSFINAFPDDIFLDDLDEHDIYYITEKKVSEKGELSKVNIEIPSDIELIINNEDNMYFDLLSDGYLSYIVINNSVKVTYGFEESFLIEIKNNENWYELVPPLDAVFTLPYYIVEPKNYVEKKIDFLSIYGELEEGSYRLINEFSINNASKFNVALEFEIE